MSKITTFKCGINKRSLAHLKNTKPTARSSTGVRGVYNLGNGYYAARVTVDKKEITILNTRDFNEAVKARKEAEEKYYQPLIDAAETEIKSMIEESRKTKDINNTGSRKTLDYNQTYIRKRRTYTAKKTSSTGLLNIYPCGKYSDGSTRYCAQVYVNGKTAYLGSSKDPQELVPLVDEFYKHVQIAKDPYKSVPEKKESKFITFIKKLFKKK